MKNIKSIMYRLFFLVIVLTAPLVFSSPIKIVTFDNNPPFSFSLPDKTLTGYYIEFWQLWANHNQHEIEFYINSFDQGLEDVKYKEVIHSGLFETEERLKWANFSIPFHKVETGVLLNRKYDKSTRLKNLNNVKVAVPKGSSQASYLKQNFKNIDLIHFDDAKNVFNQLFYNEIDAIVGETPFIKAELAKLGLYGVLIISDEVLMTDKVHAMVAKENKELLEIVNRGILKIPRDEIIELEKKWMPSTHPFFSNEEQIPFLTSEENNWLKMHGNFSLGIDSSWYPYDYIDDKGQHSGIAADYIKYLSEILGVNISPEYQLKWRESFKLFNQGKIDIMSSVVATDERKKTINFTQAYFETPTVIVTKKDVFNVNELRDLIGKKLGLVEGFAIVELVKKDFPNIKIELSDSIVEGLENLESGKIDAFLGTLAVVNLEIEKNNLDQIKVAAFSPYEFEISMTVRKGLEPLVNIFNKALNNMSEKQKASIANDWLAIHIITGTDIKTVLKWSLPILTLLILVIIIISSYNNKLQIQIRQRELAEKELHYLAHHDSLTGLPNWRNFESQFKTTISSSNPSKHALLFLDLNGFKKINDTYGHQAGDAILIETANRLKQSINNKGLLARIGGDEFLIALEKPFDKSQIEESCQTIIDLISQPLEWQGNQIVIGTSIGISIYPDHSEDLNELVKYADFAMYKAKEQGKNNCQFH